MYDLDKPLIKIDKTHWTARNAVEGVQIFGGIGSGKTSGSGRTLALKYLAAGFGGLVLTVKPDERAMWEEYGRITGRSDDFIIVAPAKKNPDKPNETPQPKHCFDFLENESVSHDGQVSATSNIVNILKTVINADEEMSAGKGNDPFWRDSLDMLMATVTDLCILAYGKVSVKTLYDIAQTLPTKEGYLVSSAFGKAKEIVDRKIDKQIEDWIVTLSSTEADRVFASKTARANAAAEVLPDARLLLMIEQFISSYVNLGEKTRSTIEFSFTGFLFNLMREPIYSLFCGSKMTFRPEDCRDGKIILIDLPVKLFHKAGRDCQILFKYIWQRAMERGNATRPAFLWADEAQNFLHEHDPDFQATARSSMIATVYLTQNLPNYYANMGGMKAEFKVKSFLGTLSTKFFHANADIETNKYASELIGDAFYEESRISQNFSQNFSFSRDKSQNLDKSFRPEEFGLLKTGGKNNNYKVSAFMHIQGGLLGNTNNTLLQFDQNYIPHPQNHNHEQEQSGLLPHHER